MPCLLTFSGGAASYAPPAVQPASVLAPRRSSWPRRKPRSPGWPPSACPTRGSAPGCSCPRAPSSTTCARSSSSSTSPHAPSSAAPYPAA